MRYIELLRVHGGRMIDGTFLTVVRFLLATLVAVVVAVLFGLMRLSRNPGVRGVATVYIEVFRGTSLLLQLFWIFLVLKRSRHARRRRSAAGGSIRVPVVRPRRSRVRERPSCPARY